MLDTTILHDESVQIDKLLSQSLTLDTGMNLFESQAEIQKPNKVTQALLNLKKKK